MSKILIVEDNKVNQKVMERLIKISGNECCIIEDGGEVINYLENNHVDLVLMDVQLVEYSGIDITKKIKNHFKLNLIPVIIVTASASKGDRDRIVTESGCDEYIAKPFFPTELFEKMSKFIPIDKKLFTKTV